MSYPASVSVCCDVFMLHQWQPAGSFGYVAGDQKPSPHIPEKEREEFHELPVVANKPLSD